MKVIRHYSAPTILEEAQIAFESFGMVDGKHMVEVSEEDHTRALQAIVDHENRSERITYTCPHLEKKRLEIRRASHHVSIRGIKATAL